MKKILTFLFINLLSIILISNSAFAFSLTEASLANPCRIAAIGDSITCPYSYADYFAAMPECRVKNFAMAGTQVAGEEEFSFVNRTKMLTVESDIILIMGGTNDFCGYNYINNPLGSASDFESDTFCGAYNRMIYNLRLHNPMSKIVLLTPIKRCDYLTINPQGCNLENYVNAVKAVAAKNGLLCIDLYNDPACDFVTLGQLPDGLHPTVTGQQIMGGQIQKALLAAGY